MAKYIELEAIMKFPIRKDHCDKERANEHFIFGIESVLEYVQNLPAADVAPVVHGRWMFEHETENTLSMTKCNVCGWWTLDPSVDGVYKYCPNCGARMDGDDDAKAD